MDDEHKELEEAFGTEDATLRIALAEAEMEISLLKIELMRTRSRLEVAEAALRSRHQLPSHDTTVDDLRHSQLIERARRTSAPPSVRPKETICTMSGFPALSREGSVLPKIVTGTNN